MSELEPSANTVCGPSQCRVSMVHGHVLLRRFLEANKDGLATYLSPYQSPDKVISEARVESDQWGRPMLIVRSTEYGTVMPNVWIKDKGLCLHAGTKPTNTLTKEEWVKPTPLPPKLEPRSAMHHHASGTHEKWTMFVSSLTLEQRARLENAKLLGVHPKEMQGCIRVDDGTPNAYPGFIERIHVYCFVLSSTVDSARERAVKGLNVQHFLGNLEHLSHLVLRRPPKATTYGRGWSETIPDPKIPMPSVIIVSPERMDVVPGSMLQHELWHIADNTIGPVPKV